MFENPFGRTVAGDSSRIQHRFAQRFSTQNTPRPVSHSVQGNFRRRIASRRSPQSGMSMQIAELDTDLTAQTKLEALTRKLLRTPQKLNGSVLEAWINNTISDAEQLDLPDILKESKLPLEKYKIDRISLLQSGLGSSDIEKLYRSLFVYSVGFFQMVSKILERTENKFNNISAVWKVFAMLIEYCCHMDYKLIITNIENLRQEEMNKLQQDFKEEISVLNEHEKEMNARMQSTKKEIRKLQRNLELEMERRMELEEEVLLKENGHEKEITMRLEFESKLNQMFAVKRDMESKILTLDQSFKNVNSSSESKETTLRSAEKKILELRHINIERIEEIERLKAKIKEIDTGHESYETRISEAYERIESLNTELSDQQTSNNELTSLLSQRTLEIDNLRCEIEVSRQQTNTLEQIIKDLKAEREVYMDRIAEVDHIFHDEIDKYKHFENEYAKVKERDNAKALELGTVKESQAKLKQQIKELQKERDSLKIHLETSLEIGEEYKQQAKLSQERIEEMNKGRRVVEEINIDLENKVNEKENELNELKYKFLDQKQEIEELKSKEVELLAQINGLQIQIESNQREFALYKESQQEKFDNLQNILESEKKVRENWIYRYEEEQKVHSSTLGDLTDLQERLNEAIVKLNTVRGELRDSQALNKKLNEKIEIQTEELLSLKASQEEYTRKNKTLELLIESIEKENQEKTDELIGELKDMSADYEMKINRLDMYIEETWGKARINLEKYRQSNVEIRKLKYSNAQLSKKLKNTERDLNNMTVLYERTALIQEDYLQAALNYEKVIRNNNRQIRDQEKLAKRMQRDIDTLKLNQSETDKEFFELKEMIPVELRSEPNPFVPLQDTIKILEEKLETIQALKDTLQDKSTQVLIQNSPMEVQTDITHTFFDELEKEAEVEAEAERERDNEEKEEDILLTIPLKPEQSEVQRPQSKERYQLTATPIQLKSVYKENDKLPEIARRTPQRPPRTAPSPPADIKRYIKQAHSRRKADL